MKKNPKFEIRKPKQIRWAESEMIAPKIFRGSDFGLSDFGFQFSVLSEEFFA